MKPSFHLKSFIFFSGFAIQFASIAIAAPGDLDDDGLRDEVETNTGTYVSPSNTGTNPGVADTDSDSVPDGLELDHGTNPTSPASKRSRPNIILINCDDLGYGDLGCFWQNQKSGNKFATPGFDAMAAEGVMLTHHYVGAPICASSRASLLQGRHQGHADIRDKQFDKALPNNHSIASVLKKGGYRTVHIGKAGLGGGTGNMPAHPLVRGFDRFFGYYSHYHAQEHYPQNGNNSRGAVIYNDYARVTDAYVDLYSTDVWTAFAKKTIVEEVQSHPNRPFFVYLAYSAPHFDNQFPPTRNYPAGGGLSGGITWTGPPSYVNTATNDPSKINNIANAHPSVISTWPQFAKEHVSMIRRIDDSLTDLLQTIRELGIGTNTLVVFTSDNGADAFRINPSFFQGYANFEGTKTDLWEGGIRVPCIAWWPGAIPATNSLSSPRAIARPSGNWDWLATFADAGSIPVPAYTDGVSMVPSLTGNGLQREKGYQYFEFNSPGGITYAHLGFTNHAWDKQEQGQAVRIGDFMGVRNDLLNETTDFRIYNVVSDPRQGVNLASSKPDLQAKMKYLAISARRPGGGASRPYDMALIPASAPGAVANGVKYQCFEGYWSCLPDFRELSPVSSGSASAISVALRSRDNDVGLSFEGYISVPTSGAYTFQSVSNGATSLWIHDGHVIDNDYNYVATRTSEPIYLTAGLHPFRLYYRHQSGQASLDLKYSGPGLALQSIPASSFFLEGIPPVLLADEFIATHGTPRLVDVLANDVSENPLVLLGSGAHSLGSSSVVSNQLRFEPTSGLLGVSDFTYTATNGVAQASGQVRATVLFDNEIWFPFEEGSGTSASQIGAAVPFSGTLVGTAGPATAWKLGRFGLGLQFDGIDDQVNLPGLVLPTDQMPRTFSFWLRTAARSTPELQTLFSYGSNFTGARYVLRLDNTENVDSDQPLRLEVNSGHMRGTRPLNDGVWHHVAVVNADFNSSGQVNVNETKIYIDGVLDPPSSFSGRVLATGSNNVPSIGGSNHNTGYNFAGSIDDLRIFPRALSDAEVLELSTAVTRYLNEPGQDSDYDGDGSSNEDEFLAGTDPMDPSSLLKIQGITVGGSNVTVSWMGVQGRDYQIEESFDLVEWHPVPGQDPVRIETPVTPGGPILPPDLSVTVPKAGPGRQYFRLRVSLSAP